MGDRTARHLIHIGYPKAGSNFLRSWFALHPQIAFSWDGIAGFSDVRQLGVLHNNANSTSVALHVTSSEYLSAPKFSSTELESPHGGSQSPPDPIVQTRVCELLHGLFSTAYILIVTRGFRSMVLSSFSQYVRCGGDEDLASLIKRHRGDFAETNAWHYDRLVRLYRRAFGDNRVIVLPYELLCDDAVAFTVELEKRFGLQHGPVPDGRINPSLSPIELSWYPALARVVGKLPGRSVRNKTLELHSRAAFNNKLRRVIALLQRLAPRAPIAAELIGDDVLEVFRGRANTLRDEPLYQRYSEDYLFSPSD